MKKIFAFTLALVILLSLVGCEKKPVLKVIVAENYSSASELLTDALVTEKIGFSVEKSASVPANDGGDIIVIGYVDDEKINEAVKGFMIHDTVIADLGGFVYIGGRKDCPEADVKAAVEKFVSENITGKGKYEVKLEENEIAKGKYSLDLATINGVPLSDFRIVYSETDGNTGPNKLVAEYLQDLIKQRTGKLPIVVGEMSKAVENEIYIGKSKNRPNSDALSELEIDNETLAYSIKGSAVVISAKTDILGYRASRELLERIEVSDNTALSTEEVHSEKVSFIKIACVGDSITQGNAGKFNYPSYLQEMLGYDYYVLNCGKSGYSTRQKDPYPYIGTYEYANAVHMNADVVIYMLGTNDCQPTKDWTEQTEIEYKESANKIFDKLEQSNPDVQIFVLLPPSLFPNNVWQGWEKWSQQVKDHAVPLNRELAEARGYTIIDAYTWSLSHPEVFTDGLHPGNETYRDFAQCVYDGIKDTLKK